MEQSFALDQIRGNQGSPQPYASGGSRSLALVQGSHLSSLSNNVEQPSRRPCSVVGCPHGFGP
jgi:hypothetical protein